MLVAIGIMAIIMAISLPAYSDWRARSAVTNTANVLIAHLKQARNLAVAENRNVAVVFGASSYTFDADTAGNCGPCKNNAISYGQFSGNISISPSTTRIFTSRGTVSQSGTITIAAGSHSKQIVLNVIGRAYLK